MTTQATLTLEEHRKECPICLAAEHGLNVYELVGATELWRWMQIHNKAVGAVE